MACLGCLAVLGTAVIAGPVLAADIAGGASPTTLYLKGDGVPSATLSSVVPPVGSLPNYDPERNADPGLTLKTGGFKWTEQDDGEFQQWIAGTTEQPVVIGSAQLTFWSAMSESQMTTKGSVDAFILDCADTGCELIQSGELKLDDWSAGSPSWVARTISFSDSAYTMDQGHRLAVKLIVPNDSKDDMWFAYDTSSYPSQLVVDIDGTTTTTEPTTTTTTSTTTTTTTTSTTTSTTTTTLPPETGVSTTTTSTTTTTIPQTTTTTTVPKSTTTTVPPGPTTTSPPPSAAATTTTTANTTTTEASRDDQDSVAGAGAPLPPPQDPMIQDLATINLTPEMAVNPTAAATPLSGRLIDAADIVLPPAVAEALLSPFIVLELLWQAISQTGKSILLPALLLGAVTGWLVTRRSEAEKSEQQTQMVPAL